MVLKNPTHLLMFKLFTNKKLKKKERMGRSNVFLRWETWFPKRRRIGLLRGKWSPKQCHVSLLGGNFLPKTASCWPFGGKLFTKMTSFRPCMNYSIEALRTSWPLFSLFSVRFFQTATLLLITLSSLSLHGFLFKVPHVLLKHPQPQSPLLSNTQTSPTWPIFLHP